MQKLKKKKKTQNLEDLIEKLLSDLAQKKMG